MNKITDMKKIKKLTFTAMFLALIIVMSFTPLGYLHIGTVDISLLAIPVAAGAGMLGVGGGAFLGLAFGVTSFIQCFGMSPFGTALMGISPVKTFIMCIIPRVLMGVGSALVYVFLKKKAVKIPAVSLVSYLSAAVLNTFFFVCFFILLFSGTEYYAGLETQFETTNIIAFFAAFVGLNGVIEAIASAAVGAALGIPLEKAGSRM